MNIKMHKGLVGIFIVALAIVIVLAVALAYLTNATSAGPSEYSAVYLTTGDVYYGKLNSFPAPHLTDVWFLQRGVDDQNQPLTSVNQFENVFWGPMDKIEISPEHIVWTATLRADSQLVQAFENPDVLQGQTQQSPQDFQGPTGQPSVEGPTGPPPTGN